MLRLEGVTKSFGGKPAVDGVSLIVPAGQMVGVIGRSGAGKSTLLRMINRLGDPTSGRILFGDTDVTALRGRPLRAWRARCAMIFQQFNLAGRLDVLTNVMMGRAFQLRRRRCRHSSISGATHEKCRCALSALDQPRHGTAWRAQRADTLSGGQQQRVAIARALDAGARHRSWRTSPLPLSIRATPRMVMDALQRINKQFRNHGDLQPAQSLDTGARLLRSAGRHGSGPTCRFR